MDILDQDNAARRVLGFPHLTRAAARMAAASCRRSKFMTSETSPRRAADLLHTRDAARRLGLGPHTLEKMRMRGTGPTFVKLGARVLYDVGDLDAWIATRRRRSTSEA
jgi:predicted DNA-binding transcriptional regulator AlpA